MADLNCIPLKYFTICKTMGDWEVATCTRSVEISVHVGFYANLKKNGWGECGKGSRLTIKFMRKRWKYSKVYD